MQNWFDKQENRSPYWNSVNAPVQQQGLLEQIAELYRKRVVPAISMPDDMSAQSLWNSWADAIKRVTGTRNQDTGPSEFMTSLYASLPKASEATQLGRTAPPIQFRPATPQGNIGDALSFLAGDIGETYHDLDSRFKNTLAGLIGPKQLQTLWPSAPDKRKPKPAERPDPDYVQGQPAMNWTTQPPDITNWDILREIASEQWAQRSPSSGYDLRNYNPYADDPLMRFRSGDPWPR